MPAPLSTSWSKRRSLFTAAVVAPLSLALAACGTPEPDASTLAVKQSAVSATSTVGRGPRFTTPANAGGDMTVAINKSKWATLFNNGDNGFTTGDLNTNRPATLAPIDFDGNGAAEWGDFDGDGRAELVLGVPMMTAVGDVPTGGFVVVHFSAADAFSSADYIRISADATATFNPYWGYALAVGDFNGDGFDDLAIGGGSNRVRVYRGSGGGLAYKWNTTWTGGYGAQLAAGDFNCDGYEDLAIAAPSRAGDGEVAVFTGSSGSLTYQLALRQVSGQRVSGDSFGGALAVGNFNGDSVGGRPCADLAVGIPSKPVGTVNGAGQVNVYYGANTTTALDAANYTAINQNTSGVPSVAHSGENFAWKLLASDLNGDGVDDLVAHTYMDTDFNSSSRCNGDAAVHAFAGKTGIGVQPAVNVWLQLPGHSGSFGAWEKKKLAVVAFNYSNSPGQICPPTMLRMYSFSATSASSLVVASESHYEPGTLGDGPAGEGQGNALTHPHAGYIR